MQPDNAPTGAVAFAGAGAGTAESDHHKDHHHHLQVEIGSPRPLSISTPTTTSPASTPFPSLSQDRDHASTPESIVDDVVFPPLAAVVDSGLSGLKSEVQGGAAATNGPSSTTEGHQPVPIMTGAASLSAAVAPSHDSSPGTEPAQTSKEEPKAQTTRSKFSGISDNIELTDDSGAVFTRRAGNACKRSSAGTDTVSAQNLPARGGRHEPLQTVSQDLVSTTRQKDSGAATTTHVITPGLDTNHNRLTITTAISPISPASDSVPLRTASVKHSTKFAQPKPIAVPTPTTAPVPINTPISEATAVVKNPFAGNVAQLEATAERLSTGTSSIGDAIRELHGELKRSDSRRSSILAASVKANGDDPLHPLPPVPSLSRHLSTSSSIVSTNNAARHGGYSPAGFIMSPSHSLTTRLRSGSKNSSGRPDLDSEPILSRQGPGKASVRSIRSTKMSLAEISESEPIALTKAALDEADVAPPIDFDKDVRDDTLRPMDNDAHAEANDLYEQAARYSFDDDNNEYSAVLERSAAGKPKDDDRTGSSHSDNTFQQAQDAFVDFDGVHWTPEPEFDLDDEPTPTMPPHVPRTSGVRPQSYMDPETGHQMLFYPARVPAMLNLPPKLSSKPKAEQRNQRRSQVLGAMADANRQPVESNRKSAAPNLRDSWLPDPLADHRQSFSALTSSEMMLDHEDDRHATQPPEPEIIQEPAQEPDTSHLRRPQRLTENRKSQATRLDNLPPQLRASAYFDLPSAAPEVEVKDGSAMATLDSILDASAHAPVSAFTDHTFAGRLGSEVYGKEKRHKSKLSTASLRPESASKDPKKRGSLMWFKRSSSYNSEDKSGSKSARSPSALGDVHGDVDVPESQALSSSVDGQSVVHRMYDNEAESDRDDKSNSEEGDDGYAGPPTTLLAELQLRKQQQKQRTQHLTRTFPNGMHATLLEMDAVAETQRKNRQNTRVTLAWEDPDAHYDQNGSDDEDVPLAIIAAKSQGAKNMADLERPVGLMERREIEDNEPLSQRRARLTGQEPVPLAVSKRRSVATLSAHLGGQVPVPSPTQPSHTPEPEEDEVEGETLGERKKRLAAKELPKARPVSTAFSAELLSQFGDPEEPKEKNDGKDVGKSGTPNAEEETLGQRRRRLQAEREAREREMSFGNLVGQAPAPALNRRLSMADVLSAHPKQYAENPAHQEQMRLEHERQLQRERDAKMAAMRMQMPQTLNGPNIDRSGGFRAGVYNDGTGGLGARSTPAVNNLVRPGLAHQRSSVTLSAYGMPVQQPGYGQPNQFAPMNNPMARYTVMNPVGHHAGGAMGTPMMSVGSMDRVEQWRHGVMP